MPKFTQHLNCATVFFVSLKKVAMPVDCIGVAGETTYLIPLTSTRPSRRIQFIKCDPDGYESKEDVRFFNLATQASLYHVRMISDKCMCNPKQKA